MQKKIFGIVLTVIAVGVATITFSLRNKASAQAAAPKAVATAPAEITTAATSVEETKPAIALPANIEIGKISQSFGHIIAKHLKNPNLPLDMEQMIKGMRDEMIGIPAPMSEEEYEKAIAQIQESIFKELSQKNLIEADAFLEKNSAEKDVITLEPKIQYIVLKEGQGTELTSESTPLIHYMGKLLDGTVFGNSYEHSDPITLPIAHTIPGFSKGLVGMKEGEKRRLFIHPDLAYGVNGHLPPNSLLIFEVEIVKSSALIEEPAAAEAASVDQSVDYVADEASAIEQSADPIADEATFAQLSETIVDETPIEQSIVE